MNQDIAQMKANKDIMGLIGALEHAQRDLRASSASALGEVGDERAVKPLIAALTDDDRLVRRMAARALGKLRDSRAVAPLKKALLEDTDWDVKSEAAQALGELGDPRALPALKTILRHQHEIPKYVVESAQYAMSRIPQPSRTRKPISAAIADLRDPDPNIAIKAAEVLGQMGGRRAIKPLLSAYQESSGAQAAAVKALQGIVGGSEAAVLLIRELARRSRYSDFQDALAAIQDALAMLDDAAVDPLIEALQHRNPYVRMGAAVALGKRGEDRAIEALLACREDKYSVSTEVSWHQEEDAYGRYRVPDRWIIHYPVREAAAKAIERITGEPIDMDNWTLSKTVWDDA